MLNAKNKQTVLEIGRYIDQANNILVLVHKMADGDAIGSMVAIMEYLVGLGKNYIGFCDGGVPDKFIFLKNRSQIVSDVSLIQDQDFDLVIALDCSNVDYTGIGDYLNRIRKDKSILITIDHHISNKGWGDINLVDAEKSATAEILFYFFNYLEIRISKGMASALLVGILTDTENFTNRATTSESMEVASRMVRFGARYNYILKTVWQDKTSESLRVWGRVLSKVQKNDKFNIAYGVVLQDDLGHRNLEVADGISNFVSNLGEKIKATLVLKEMETGEIKVSLRSLDGQTNVLKIAELFGGGGHIEAAGFSVKGRLERAGNSWQLI